ncbi:S24 family peptidase [uncultured Shewanella sp.]|uniref:XRE family transcriptional regulator n=1 Tax=uncultured Shewanella sp. TaxID=173975 RepID=UPI0026093C8B|nr:S24 family peptidase [uncultured Shewanella sp.]
MNNKTSVTSELTDSTLHKRIKQAIGSDSNRSFASKINISEGTLRRILKGEDPKLSIISKIANETGVDLNWLITGNSDQIRTESSSLSIEKFDDIFSLIPSYNVRISTGHGHFPSDEAVNHHLAFRKRWLKHRGINPEKLAVVFAHGDSMEPTIQSGNSLLVNTEDVQLTDGSIFALRFGDELYAKRLQKRFDGSVELISDNKEYKDQLVEKKDINELKIIGKVVWVGKDLY